MTTYIKWTERLISVHIHIHVHTHTHTPVFVNICVCVCLCAFQHTRVIWIMTVAFINNTLSPVWFAYRPAGWSESSGLNPKMLGIHIWKFWFIYNRHISLRVPVTFMHHYPLMWEIYYNYTRWLLVNTIRGKNRSWNKHFYIQLPTTFL